MEQSRQNNPPRPNRGGSSHWERGHGLTPSPRGNAGRATSTCLARSQSCQLDCTARLIELRRRTRISRALGDCQPRPPLQDPKPVSQVLRTPAIEELRRPHTGLDMVEVAQCYGCLSKLLLLIIRHPSPLKPSTLPGEVIDLLRDLDGPADDLLDHVSAMRHTVCRDCTSRSDGSVGADHPKDPIPSCHVDVAS